jgi:hypothetical protein
VFFRYDHGKRCEKGRQGMVTKFFENEIYLEVRVKFQKLYNDDKNIRKLLKGC